MVKKFITPFEGIAKKGTFGAKTSNKLQIKELNFSSTVQVIAFSSTGKKLDGIIKKLLGKSLPDVGKAVDYKKGRIQWVGKNRYQIISNDKTLFKTLNKEISPDVASIVDLSHSRGILQLTGDVVENVLAKGASVDFKGEGFSKNSIVLTNMAHIGVIVDCVDRNKNQATVNLSVFRTFGKSFYHFVQDASEEYGYTVK